MLFTFVDQTSRGYYCVRVEVLRSGGLKRNTVQLVNKDVAFRRLGGLWMVLVVRAFRGPFEDLAFDDAGVGAVSA
ncbi:hypothetical protein, partial [Rhodococcus koreensis]